MPNPTLGVAADASSTEDEHVPNPGLNLGPPSNPRSPVDHAPKTPLWDDDDTDTERPTKIQRCSLCYDFDQLLEAHLRLAEDLEKSEKKVAELEGILDLLS